MEFIKLNKYNVQNYKKSIVKKFDCGNIEEFVINSNNYVFIAIVDNDVVAFLYGYGLFKPDGKSMFYIHSIDVLTDYQNQHIGTKLLDYVLKYVKNENKYYKFFVLADVDNIKARKLYSKYAKDKEQILFNAEL